MVTEKQFGVSQNRLILFNLAGLWENTKKNANSSGCRSGFPVSTGCQLLYLEEAILYYPSPPIRYTMATPDLLKNIQNKAKALGKTIVFPDATDERAIQAARILADQHIVHPVLIGKREAVEAQAAKTGTSLAGILLVDPAASPDLDRFGRLFHELRKAKGLSAEEARTTMLHPLFFGAMMVREGMADGSVAGSLSTTGDVLRAAIQVIGLADAITVVSSFFVMIFPERLFSFADCAVVPDPTAEQLADIGASTADNHRRLTGETPRVAMLSFSTKGSASHPDVEKVQQATAILKRKRPDLAVDGELQLDAAIVPKVGQSKAPGSPIAGNANVLIFPDLNSGNIGYKLAQRLASAEAVGPVVQGLRKPAFDLSRGCSVSDIVNVAAINAVVGAV
jgi:phosphate acetyltransferase